jgi:Ca-activated chloride channel homolog
LQWKPRQAADRPALQVWIEADSGTAETYFLATVTPPTSGEAIKVPGEYVLLVDRSGSMDGPKRAAADWAVEKFLLGLGKDDWFTLGLFHNTTRWFSRTLVKAGESNVQGAIALLRNYTEHGGTELGVALEQALQVNRRTEGQSRHLLIITDAEVTDGGRILRLASDDAKRVDRRRISILCIDAAPNAYLALELADRGGGLARFLTSDPGEGDITTALDRIMEFWSRTICTDLRLFASSPLIAADRDVCHIGNGCSYVSLGDLPAGHPVWVAGKVAGPDTSPGDASPDGLSFCLTLQDGEKGKPLTPDAMQRLASRAGIKSIYGARKLLGLETLIHSRYQGSDLREGLTRLGYDPEQVLFYNKKSGLYPENNQVNETAALRDFIVSESLKYGLPSSEAAFIAVYRRSGKRVEATALVPNALPHGWSGTLDKVCNNSAMPLPPQMSARSGRKMSRFQMNPSTGIIDMIDRDDIFVPEAKSRSNSEPAGRRSSSGIDRSDEATSVEVIIFDGVPRFDGNEAVIFDSSLDTGALAGSNHRLLAGIRVRFSAGDRRQLDAKGLDLDLKIFVGDMTMPMATVKLADFVRLDRLRPLNIDISAGPRVKVALSAPSGAPSGKLPGMVLGLQFR